LLLVDFPRLLPVFIVDIFTGDDLDELGLKVLIFFNCFLKDVLRSRCSHGSLRVRLWSFVSAEIQKKNEVARDRGQQRLICLGVRSSPPGRLTESRKNVIVPTRFRLHNSPRQKSSALLLIFITLLYLIQVSLLLIIIIDLKSVKKDS
jgi:hypothetical protein